MSTDIENKIADVYDAARAYVHARVECEGSDERSALTNAVRVDETWHDLAALVNDECTICDLGTCPILGEVSDV